MAIDPTEIQLTPNQQAYIAERSESTGTPWPELLGNLVPAIVARSNGKAESAYEMAKRLGYIGMSDVGPSDLATNPIHMHGFGQDEQ